MQILKGFIFFGALALFGCGGNNSTKIQESTDKINKVPIITIQSQDQIIPKGIIEVQLIASAEDDSGIKSVVWVQTSGPQVTLDAADTLNASFSVPVVTYKQGQQALTFDITVTDIDNESSKAQVRVLVEPNNYAPQLNLISPMKSYINDSVLIEVLATDQDGTIEKVTWEQLTGPQLSTTQGNSKLMFDVPFINQQETVTFKAIVFDDKETSTAGEVTINLVPTERLVITTNTKISTQAGALTLIDWQVDNLNKALEAELIQTSGPNVALIQYPEKNTFTFIAPENAPQDTEITFELKVKDAFGQVNVQMISVIVEPINTVFLERRQIFGLTPGVNIFSSNFVKIDGDDHFDLVTIEKNGLNWYRNLGDGTYDIDKSPNLIKNTLSTDNSNLQFFDIDGNGLSDLIDVSVDTDLVTTLDVYFNLGSSFSEKKIQAVLPRPSYLKDIYIKVHQSETDSLIIVYVDNEILIFKVIDSSLEKLTEFAMEDKILPLSLAVCEADDVLFFRTIEEVPSNERGWSELYSLNISTLEEPQSIQRRSLHYTSATCLTASNGKSTYIEYVERGRLLDYSQAVEYSNGNHNIKTISLPVHKSSQGTFNIPLLNPVKNRDGYDDLIIADKDDKSGAVKVESVLTYLATNTVPVFQPLTLPDLCIDNLCDGFFVDNESVFLFKSSSNSVQFTLLDEPNNVFDINFEKDISIVNLSQFGEQLKVRTTLNDDASLQSNYLTNFSAGQLSLNGDYDLSSLPIADYQGSESTIFVNYDSNKDGILDVFSTVTRSESTYRKTDLITSFIATDDYFQDVSIISEIGTRYDDYLDNYYIKMADDVNSDGHVDFLLSYTVGDYITDYEWTLYDNEISDWKVNKSIPSDEFIVFIDTDNSGLKDAIQYSPEEDYYSGGYHGGAYDFDPKAGYLSIKKQSVINNFDGAYIVDNKLKAFKDIKIFDVNRDGKMDILITYYAMKKIADFQYEIDKSTLLTSWYDISDQGDFIEHTMPSIWNNINIFDTNDEGYFTEFDINNGKIYEYSFIDLLNIPALSRIIDIGFSAEKLKHLLFDIDNDGDIDIILYDNYNIYLHENTGGN